MFRRDKEGRAFLDCLAALGTFGPPAPGLAVTGETTPEGQEGEGRRSQEEAMARCAALWLGGPGGIRTHDSRIKSPELYR